MLHLHPSPSVLPYCFCPHSCPAVLTSVQRRQPLRAAGLRMRELLPAPAGLQGLLRYFHHGRADRSRAASTQKHLCAHGSALWTHIRNLVRKGKVGRGCIVVSRVGSLAGSRTGVSLSASFFLWSWCSWISRGGGNLPCGARD